MISKHDQISNQAQTALLRWSMRFAGFWPYDLCGKFSLLWLTLCFWSIFLLLIVGFAMCTHIHQNIHNIPLVIDTICTLSTNIICDLKLAWIVYKRKLFYELIDVILSNAMLEANPLLEWQSYTPSHFALNLRAKSELLLDNNWKEFRLVSRVFFAMVMITALSYMMIPLGAMAYMNYVHGYSPRYHAYNVDYTLLSANVSETPFYEVSFLHETYVGFDVYSVVVGADGIYCCFVMYLCNQIRLLQQMFVMIDEEIDLADEEAQNNQIKRDRLMHCVRHHRTLMEYLNDLEKAFGPINLFQTLISSILICVIAFRSSIATTDLTNILTKIPYLLAAIAQLFLYSYYGQTLINESTELSASLYNAIWYENSDTFGQDMLIILPQLQRPLKLSAMGYLTMSLDTFKRILSTAMSYFTLLQSMTEPAKDE